VKSLNAIVENLAQSRRALLMVTDAVPAEHSESQTWRQPLVGGRTSRLSDDDRTKDHQSRGSSALRARETAALSERFEGPMVVVEARLFRRISPIPVESETIREKEEMLSDLREVREGTLAFIGETRGRDLSRCSMTHPFLGTLTAYEWFQFIASHEIRHTKQMAEIAAALPKNIAKLQK
jgi:hypothetical protein